MMEKNLILSAVAFMSMVFCRSTTATEIRYQLTDLGDDRFEYLYTVENSSLQVAIEQFRIQFDESLYDELQITTQQPLANDWDEIILYPTPFGDPFEYDALALVSGISPGQSAAGFAVSFDWLGTGTPSQQFYEIIDTTDYHIIDTGHTVPEPTTFLLLGLGGLGLLRKRKR